MNKIFINTLLIIFLFFTHVNSEIVNDVDISGNKRISNETILVLGDIKLNNDFDENDLNNTLKKLYDTNFFKDVNLSIFIGLLYIDLVEIPIFENGFRSIDVFSI